MNTTLSAFRGTHLVASGAFDDVMAVVRPLPDAANILFFENATGRQTDYDLNAPKPGPGRPKLGVVSTEVTLLPRHWEWLNAQPARASGTLRRLVEEAMARETEHPKQRAEALGRILWAVAGNEPDFEEACRALYAGDQAGLERLSQRWSGDLPAFVRSWT